jgi:acyl dehydratase
VITEPDVQAWVGRTHSDPFGDVEVERGAIMHWCEATENANPIFWDFAVASEVTGGPIAPPSMLSVWMRPLAWRPGGDEQAKPLSLHFALKEALGLPEGIVKANEISFGTPLRPGDRVRTTQLVREIGEVRTTRLGTGRDWIIDVTYTNQRGEVAGVESYEFFSYVRLPHDGQVAREESS